MSFANPSASLLVTCGGDTVKIFDVTVDSGDPCTLSYSPSPGSQVNCVRWNHNNLELASAGDDNKISMWHKNGQTIGTVPLCGSEVGNDIEESISSISFSNRDSGYLCSGGSGHMVRIWDLQRKRCINRLSGHTDTISCVMYNCKDEHLASISLNGKLILHNLTSGARAAELKDPNEQALRVLDYSRLSRHILVTAGDDGSVHLWDTSSRNPKASWLKQHSAPTTGLCFSPSSDKVVASVGLDKKLYTFDLGTKRPTFCAPYEVPFSSLRYSDDGNILAAGTNNGRVVFYDVRGKPQPFTVLRAYSNTEAVTSVCWQRSTPVMVNENNCNAETALLGGSCEDYALMPDPLPSLSTLGFSSATTGPVPRPTVTVTTSGAVSTTSYLSTLEETPSHRHVRPVGSLTKLRAPRSTYDFKDDMNVFSPLADVQPITPSLGNWWDDLDEAKKDSAPVDKNSAMLPSSIRRFPFTDGKVDPYPISNWRSSSILRQDDTPSFPLFTTTPVAPSKSESSPTPTPPEAWGGNVVPDKLNHHQQSVSVLTHNLHSVSLGTGSIFSGSQDSSFSSHFAKSSLSCLSASSTNMQSKIGSSHDHSVPSDFLSVLNSTAVSTSFGTKATISSANLELPGSVSSTLPRRYSTYAERIGTASSFNDAIGSIVSSPKSKKTGSETREDLVTNLFSRQGTSTAIGTGNLPAINGVASQPLQSLGQSTDQQQGASFSLQLIQRTLEETLGSVQRSIHEDVRNLHIELLRQFHLQETELSSMISGVLEKQDELMKEVQSLQREPAAPSLAQLLTTIASSKASDYLLGRFLFAAQLINPLDATTEIL